MEFIDLLNGYSWENAQKSILSKTKEDVERALTSDVISLEDFKALISPSAIPYLEEMARRSQIITQKRFGKTIQLYIPLYLSNVCENHCVYCGFNKSNSIGRIILNDEQIIREVEIIKLFGYEHLLLVTGESQKVGIEYFKNAFNILRNYFSQLSIEVQPLKREEYEELIELGLNTVYLYQETYNKYNYNLYHPKGRKADFNYRLDTYERMGKAGIYKMGLGVLLGLEDWRTDSFFTAMHLKYLRKTYWKTKYSVSFPRLRPHTGNFQAKNPISDKELLQLICAYRLYDNDVEISLSTRENSGFRNNMMKLGVTAMSAGSRTEPGGYASACHHLKQFETEDNRTPIEVADMIRKNGYEAVWKDWDVCLQ